MTFNIWGLFNAKAILEDEQQWHCTFPKGISPKGKLIAWLESESAYCYVAVQHIDHYVVRTPHLFDKKM